MLGSVLSLLTVSAVVLAVPVFAAVLGLERRRHLAVAHDRTRGVRLAVAALFAGLAALGVAAVVHADSSAATVVAMLITVSVVAWSPLTRSWAVRGVVVWALLVTAACGLLAWLVERIVTASLSATGVVVSAVAWVLLVASLARLQRYARDLISAQTGLRRAVFRHRRIPLLRPVVSLVVLVAAGGVVAVATTQGTSAARGRAPQAGAPGVPSAYTVPPAGPSLTQGAAAPGTVGIDLLAATWRRAGLLRPGVSPTIAASLLGPVGPGATAGATVPTSGSTGGGGAVASPSAAPTTTGTAPALRTSATSQPRRSWTKTQAAPRVSSLGSGSSSAQTAAAADPEPASSPRTATRTSDPSAQPAATDLARMSGYDQPTRSASSPSSAADEPKPTPQPGSGSPDPSSPSTPAVPSTPSSPSSPSGPSAPSTPADQPSSQPTSQPSDPTPSGTPSDTPSGTPGSQPSDVHGPAPASEAGQQDKAPGQGKALLNRPTDAPSPGLARRPLP